MCPTPTGRIHTRVATLVLPAMFGLLLSVVTGDADWILLIGLLLLLGVALDAGIYSWLLRYQPPWMTGVLAVTELALLLVLAAVLSVDVAIHWAIVFYWIAWTLAILTKIVILPIASLTYLESAGEFRHTRWSIPPSQAAFPILAATHGSPGPIVGAGPGPGASLAPRPAPRPRDGADGLAGARPTSPTERPGGASARSGRVTPAASGLQSREPAIASFESVEETPHFPSPPTPRRRVSAARRVEATAACYIVVFATALSLLAYFAAR